MKTPKEMAEEYAAGLVFDDGVYNTAEKAFLAGYITAQPQWISLQTEIPEIGTRILLKTVQPRNSWEHPMVTGYRLAPAGKNEPWFHLDTGLWCGSETVTHWQPLPPAPKEEK
jgi:hypothetical protein